MATNAEIQPADVEWFAETHRRISEELRRVIVGQEEVVESVLAGLAANGHVLLEGMPGLGKTLLVRSLAETLQLQFSRIQFTPDMMPADVTGTNVLSEDRSFAFRSGPIFANIVLADEINRATPKTQSALLEAMQERGVTVGGRRHVLPEPFLVMATQNPIEQEGTYPLPEAQLDRFFVKVLVPYPSKEELAEVVRRTTAGETATLNPVASGEDVVRMRQVVRAVPIAESVLDHALELVVATHAGTPSAAPATTRYLSYGSSPRGAQALVTLAKVFALRAGRFNVSKDDLQRAVKPVLRHRVLRNFEAEAEGLSTDQILDDVVAHAVGRDRDPIRA